MVVEGVLLLENYFSLGCVSSEGLLLSLWMMQNSDADDYVEFPLMFTIQNEGESALLHYNLKAEYNATGRTFNLTDPDFVVCNRCPPPFPHAQGSGLSSWLASKCLNCEAPGRLIPAEQPGWDRLPILCRWEENGPWAQHLASSWRAFQSCHW
jgi:hypothetical protein